jgi:cytochrome c-type biogenesis protein CcmH
MGLLWLAILGVAALGLLWLLKLRGPVLTLAAAAVVFGCAGYALQGRPDLDGSPRASAKRQPPMPLAGARHALTGQFDYADSWLNLADALASRGRTGEAARLLQAQVARHPGDYKLWLGLGNALADHSRTLSPAARFAFERSAALAPGHPAPLFFLGLAEARSGNPQEAIRLWREILAAAPANASWRPLVENALLLIQPPQAGS